MPSHARHLAGFEAPHVAHLAQLHPCTSRAAEQLVGGCQAVSPSAGRPGKPPGCCACCAAPSLLRCTASLGSDAPETGSCPGQGAEHWPQCNRLRDSCKSGVLQHHCGHMAGTQRPCHAPGTVAWNSSRTVTQPTYPRAAEMCSAVEPWDSQGVMLCPMICASAAAPCRSRLYSADALPLSADRCRAVSPVSAAQARVKRQAECRSQSAREAVSSQATSAELLCTTEASRTGQHRSAGRRTW